MVMVFKALIIGLLFGLVAKEVLAQPLLFTC